MLVHLPFFLFVNLLRFAHLSIFDYAVAKGLQSVLTVTSFCFCWHKHAMEGVQTVRILGNQEDCLIKVY